MFGFCPLASGSSGNAIYFGSKKTKILIDCGIGYLDLISRLNKINIYIEEIEAILITHEHSDHISGLKTLLPKIQIPIFTNSETAKGIYNNLHISANFKIFTTDETFEYKDLSIHPFSIQHDTLDPVGFVIQTNNLKIGFCTDIGFATSLIKKKLSNLDYLYLEANHDIDMLFASKRPIYLKKRIAGRQGHLSNLDAINLIQTIIHPNLKHIHLAHISSECNSGNLVKKLIENLIIENKLNTKISLTYQNEISNKIIFN